MKDITDHCGYSTATFYRQFRDKYDLIAWDYARGVSALMDRIDRDGYAWKQYDAAPEELAEIYENSLPAPLRPYLYRET